MTPSTCERAFLSHIFAVSDPPSLLSFHHHNKCSEQRTRKCFLGLQDQPWSCITSAVTTWDYPELGKEASGVYFIGFLKGKVPQILRTRLAPNENIKIPFGRWASLRKASSKGPSSHQWHICASQDIRGLIFSLRWMLGSLKRGVFKRGKNLGCTVFLLLKGCMAKPPKTSRTVFLSPVEQSLAVHIPKWWWLLSTDTFRRAAALEVGPQASSACYMHRQTPEGSVAARGLR